MFLVFRPCACGECPCSECCCDCSDPRVEVDVDELSPAELDHFRAEGTEDQRLLIQCWLDGDLVAEQLAGERDTSPCYISAAPDEAASAAGACATCEDGRRCIAHSPLQYEGD